MLDELERFTTNSIPEDVKKMFESGQHAF